MIRLLASDVEENSLSECPFESCYSDRWPFGRFGGAERAALVHYSRFKEAGKDVDLFADFTDKHLWARQELNNISFTPLPQSLGEPESITLSRDPDDYDRILIHHHVEPLLAYRIVRSLGKKTAWYSGSIFEPAYSDLLTWG